MPRPLLTPLLVAVLLAPAASVAQDAAPAVLTPEEAVRIAIRQSPTLEVARRERNVDLLEADRNRPGFRPEVSATVSQILRAPQVDLPGRRDAVVLPNSISRFEVGLKTPLYQFGAGSAPGARADAMAAAARSEYDQAVLDLALQVRESYLDLLRAQAFAEVARRGLALAREHVEQTKLLESRGLQAAVDVLQAQRSEAEAESSLLKAEHGVVLARANVNRVLGRELETAFSPADPEALPGEPEPVSVLAARAIAERPEIALLRHQIEAAEAGIRLARAARQPRVDLDVAYALQTETALVPRSGIAAGVSLRVPIFDSAVHRYTVREAEERLAQLRSALRAAEQGVELEVTRERLGMEEARSRIRTTERAVTAAEEVLSIARLRLERGHAVQLEVENARLALQRALTDRAAAELDLRLARARLDRALGLGVPAGAVEAESAPR